jgi:hypothetical protein
MKTIKSIQTWVDGKSVNATIFNMYPIGGTLGSSASFYYSLMDDKLVQVSQGNVTMDGEAYQNWGNNDDYAWQWAASENVLNLTITGDYIPPVPPEPTPEPESPIEPQIESPAV